MQNRQHVSSFQQKPSAFESCLDLTGGKRSIFRRSHEVTTSHHCQLNIYIYMGVSLNSGTPKSSILIGVSNINHPFWGTTILGHPHIFGCLETCNHIQLRYNPHIFYPFNSRTLSDSECMHGRTCNKSSLENDVGVSKNRGKNPKMDGENNGKPYVLMDDLRGKPTIFGNIHASTTIRHSHAHVQTDLCRHNWFFIRHHVPK